MNASLRVAVNVGGSVLSLALLTQCGSIHQEFGSESFELYGPRYEPAFELAWQEAWEPTWVVDVPGEPFFQPAAPPAPVLAPPSHGETMLAEAAPPDGSVAAPAAEPAIDYRPPAATRDDVLNLAAMIVARSEGQASASLALKKEIDQVFERFEERHR